MVSVYLKFGNLFVEPLYDLYLLVIEGVGDVDFVVVRIDKTSLRRTEMMESIVVESLLLGQGAYRNDSFPMFHGLKLERTEGIASCIESLELVPVEFVIDREGLSREYFLFKFVSPQTGHVGLIDVSEFRVMLGYPVSDLETRVDEFYLVLRTLQHRFAVNLDQFVDVSETWLGLARGYGVADPVAVDLGSLELQVGDKVFIEGIGRENLAIL